VGAPAFDALGDEMNVKALGTWTVVAAAAYGMFTAAAFGEDRTPNGGGSAAPVLNKPFRTFVTIQRYTVENNGEPSNPISNVRLEITFPNGNKVTLPEGGQYWPIGNGQVQEINRTFEIPYSYISKDGFKMTIQMYRKGAKMFPCNFHVTALSQFNRAYVCKVDEGFQRRSRIAEQYIDREGVQLRVFTDLNSEPGEIPTDAIALR
jgi:hypothetical protein